MLFIYAVIFLAPIPLYGWQPAFKYYGVENGLPSSSLFHVVQDHDGYIWLASDKGVSQYDGRRFQNYSAIDGLSSNTVFYLYCDPSGALWFNEFNKKLCVYKNGIIEPYVHTEVLTKWLGNDRINGMYIDDVGNLWLGITTHTKDKSCIIHLTPTGQIHEVDFEQKNGILGVKQFGDHTVILGTNVHTPDQIYHLALHRTTDSISQKLTFNPFKGHRVLSACAIDTTQTALCAGTRLSIIDKEGIDRQKTVGETTNSLMFDGPMSLWVGLADGGLLELDLASLETKRRLLDDYIITSMTIDHENGYWFTSHDDGVIYCNNLNVLLINESEGLPDNRFADFNIRHDTLWVAHRTGHLSTLTTNGLVNTTRLGPYLGYTALLPNGKMLIGGGQKKNTGFPNTFSSCYALCSTVDDKENVWLGGTRGIARFDARQAQCIRQDSQFDHRVEAMAFFNDTLWVGTLDGLYFMSESVVKKMSEHPLHDQRIVDMVVVKDYLVVATQSYGILQNNGKRWTEMGGIHLAECLINDLDVFKDTLWVSTNKGLFFRRSNAKNRSFAHRSIYHGLPTQEIGRLQITEKGIWFSCHLGIGYLPHRGFNDGVPPRIELKKLGLNHTITQLDTLYRVNYLTQQLSIAYEGISFRYPGHLTYRYRFPPLVKEWTSSDQNVLQFNSLSPETYRFEVQAVAPDGGMSLATANFQLEILKAPWHTAGFKILVVAILLTSIILILKTYLTRLKKRHELEQQLDRLSNSAMRKLMNPHFIYNSLNTIQSFISKNDRTNSMKYLSRFSRLIRQIFRNSDLESISLKEELETAHLFVSLESQRRRRVISLLTEFPDDLSPEAIEVPPLFLQPFIENATIHGILPSNVPEGIIQLSIRHEDSGIRFEIVNNGKSIETDLSDAYDLTKTLVIPAGKGTKERHGLTLTLARIKNFNRKYGRNLALKFSLKPNAEGPNGTIAAFNLAMLPALKI